MIILSHRALAASSEELEQELVNVLSSETRPPAADTLRESLARAVTLSPNATVAIMQALLKSIDDPTSWLCEYFADNVIISQLFRFLAISVSFGSGDEFLIKHFCKIKKYAEGSLEIQHGLLVILKHWVTHSDFIALLGSYESEIFDLIVRYLSGTNRKLKTMDSQYTATLVLTKMVGIHDDLLKRFFDQVVEKCRPLISAPIVTDGDHSLAIAYIYLISILSVHCGVITNPVDPTFIELLMYILAQIDLSTDESVVVESLSSMLYIRDLTNNNQGLEHHLVREIARVTTKYVSNPCDKMRHLSNRHLAKDIASGGLETYSDEVFNALSRCLKYELQETGQQLVSISFEKVQHELVLASVLLPDEIQKQVISLIAQALVGARVRGSTIGNISYTMNYASRIFVLQEKTFELYVPQILSKALEIMSMVLNLGLSSELPYEFVESIIDSNSADSIMPELWNQLSSILWRGVALHQPKYWKLLNAVLYNQKTKHLFLPSNSNPTEMEIVDYLFALCAKHPRYSDLVLITLIQNYYFNALTDEQKKKYKNQLFLLLENYDELNDYSTLMALSFCYVLDPERSYRFFEDRAKMVLTHATALIPEIDYDEASFASITLLYLLEMHIARQKQQNRWINLDVDPFLVEVSNMLDNRHLASNKYSDSLIQSLEAMMLRVLHNMDSVLASNF